MIYLDTPNWVEIFQPNVLTQKLVGEILTNVGLKFQNCIFFGWKCKFLGESQCFVKKVGWNMLGWKSYFWVEICVFKLKKSK